MCFFLCVCGGGCVLGWVGVCGGGGVLVCVGVFRVAIFTSRKKGNV